MRILFFMLFSISAIPAHAQRFTYEDLVDLIQSKHLQSLEEVLPLLPEELRSHYTLMRDSRSLQEASDLAPRVIMYGRDARLTCTFNGDPSQRGYDSLECFQFRDETNSFDFRQIQFPTKENGLLQVEYSESNRSADKTISCKGCHMADPRPNWDSYSKWPGAYGENDDTPQDNFQKYSRFVAKRAKDPRYQWLIQQDYAEAPYMAETYFDIDHRPNLRFGEAIGRLMGLRGYRLLQTRLGEMPALGFAVGALQCLFTDEQKGKLSAAGVDLERELNVAEIFGRMKMSGREWSAVIFNDTPSSPTAPWEHQFGYTFLKENVAMAAAQTLAKTYPSLAATIDKIKEYFKTAYKEPDRRFYTDMNETLLGLDYFGGGYTQNRKYICDEMTKIFTEKETQK
jgi:hypothetical protein